VEEFLPLVSKCERRLASFSTFLSQAGRLKMTNVVLSSLPTFYLCTFKLQETVIKQIDKFRKHCLWRGSDLNTKTPPKAAWDLVCLPKNEGGLGVIRLQTHNEPLVLKNLHKFYNKQDIPWVHLIWEKYYRSGKLPNHTMKGSFWWRDNLRLLNLYKGLARVIVGAGNTCSLWLDQWEGQTPCRTMPELFSFARNQFLSINKAKSILDLNSILHLPISQEAYLQLVQLAQMLENVIALNEPDIWTYVWGSPWFSAAKVYTPLIGHRTVHPAFCWLWKSAAQNKHKVFFWLLLHDRLSTRNMLRRKNMALPSFECVLCSLHVEETLEHLFLECSFAQTAWGLLNLNPPLGPLFETLESFKVQLGVNFFMDIIIMLSWCIWMERNDFIFKHKQPAIVSVRDRFKTEFSWVILRAKDVRKPSMSLWIDSIF
jgi:hypothetical protein